MPIRPEQRHFYPIDWPQLSAAIRFGRAGGRCERCGRPHGGEVWHWGEGAGPDRTDLWWDDAAARWRGEDGQRAMRPDLGVVLRKALRQTLRQGVLWPRAGDTAMRAAEGGLRRMRVVLSCCHLDHDPSNNAPANLAALCQRCHLRHDAADNRARRRANRYARETHGLGRLAL